MAKIYLREAFRLETRVKGVIIIKRELFSFCIVLLKNGKIAIKSNLIHLPRDLILGSFRPPQISLSGMEGIRVLPQIGQNTAEKHQNLAQEGIHFRVPLATRYKNHRNNVKFQSKVCFRNI